MKDVSRRTFLKLSGLAGGGLLLGIGGLAGCGNPQVAQMSELASTTGDFSPNAFLTVTTDNRIILAMNKAEMGQGIMTGCATLVAEELQVPVSKIEAVHAHKREFERSIGEASIDTKGVVGMQITGGSSSVAENWMPLREAAASAREMLLAAAAAKWGVSKDECETKDGVVTHKSGKSAKFGELTKLAAEQEIVEAPPLKGHANFSVIGKEDTRRVDAAAKVNGTAVFGIDVKVENMVRAYVVHPPTYGGLAEKVDEGKARSVKGVIDIFPFERGVAVIAEKFWQAQKAASELKITWDGGKLGGLDSKRIRDAAVERVKDEPVHTLRSDGDAESSLEDSDLTVVEATYEAPYLAHATMEPMNATVHVQDGKVKIWAPNQSPTIMAEAAARLLDISRDDVEVETTMLGGGFGRRGVPDFVIEALMIGRRVKRPVQLIWTRDDDTKMGYYRPQTITQMSAAMDKEGNVVALRAHNISQDILVDQMPTIGAVFPDWVAFLTRKMMSRRAMPGPAPGQIATEGLWNMPYNIENVEVGYTPVYTNMPVCFWRSVGHSYSGMVMEGFISELAAAAKEDEVAFRKKLLKGNPRHLAVLEEAAKLGEWGKPIDKGWGRGVAVHKSFGTYVAEVVEAGVFDGAIKVRKVTCVVDCGTAVNPDIVRAQMESGIIYGLSAALMQKIDLVDGVVQQANFDTYPAIRMNECPQIVVKVMPSKEKPAGVGEPGLPPIAPAVAGAIFHASGQRLRNMPFNDALKS